MPAPSRVVQLVQQQLVLEHAARATTVSSPCARQSVTAASASPCGHGRSERPGRSRAVAARRRSSTTARSSGRKSSSPSSQRKGVRRGRRRAPGELLEPDRRLPLEGHRAGEAQQRRGGIEQAARRRRREDPGPGLEQAPRRVLARRESRRGPGSRSGKLVELGQKARGGLHRMARGGVAARRARPAAGARRASKPVPNAAGEDLAAPDRAVVAVARAVEAHAEHALVPGPALGEHRRYVRAMVLHRPQLGRAGSASA